MAKPRSLLVLDWTGHWYDADFLAPREVIGVDGGPLAVRCTQDRSALDRADIVWFHGPTVGPVERLPDRRPGQVWALMTMESFAHHPFSGSVEAREIFDVHMSHRLDADVPTPYMGWHHYPGIRRPRHGARPPLRDAVLYLASNPVPDRDAVVRRLMERVRIESAGASLNTYDPEPLVGPRRVNDPTQTVRLLEHYPLVLAFENACEVDYATEKLYRPLSCGVVPVVRGAPNVRDLVPDPTAIIVVDDFESHEALGDHLAHVLDHPEALAAHLSWRDARRSPAFDRLAAVGTEAPIGRLARKVAHGCGPEGDCGGRLRMPEVVP